MILGSYDPLEVGSVVTAKWKDGDKIHDAHPFFIVRKATMQEWEAFVREQGDEPDSDLLTGAYFYEVSTD